MTRALSFQIGIETTTRCGGACAGCALTSPERHDPKGLNEALFVEQLFTAQKWLESQTLENTTEVEAITVFFGQGDHFLMSEEELTSMAALVGRHWPESWRKKTVFLLTASAVTRTDLLRARAEALRQEGLKHRCNWFVQVVFDPKKFTQSRKFKEVYMGNILFLKELFTMVELTVNLAGDIADHMTPLEFHEWVKTHKVKHVEFNLAARKELESMWKSDLPKVWGWLKEVTSLAWQDRVYEINFMPWSVRRLKLLERGEEGADVLGVAERALYITGKNDALPAQVGPIGNVSPWVDRLESLPISEQRMKLKVMRQFATFGPCTECKYKNVCASGGVYPWTQYLPLMQEKGCPWGLAEWYQSLEGLLARSPNYKGDTIFDKNPVPDRILRTCDTQETRDYFESKRVGDAY